MKIIKKMLLLAGLAILTSTQAQTIGTKLPDFPGLPDAKDHLLILDFFTTNCANCIAAVPRLNALREHYRGKLDIVMISPEPTAVVSSFFAKNTFTSANRLPVISADSVLSAYFPHRLVPHEIWVYRDTIRAITAGDLLSEPYIDSILAGKRPYLPFKNDYSEFDFSQPLYEAFPPDNYSLVLPYLKDAEVRNGLDTLVSRHALRYYDINAPLMGAYGKLFGQLRKWTYFIKPARIITDGVDRDRFIKPASVLETIWHEQNDICFEAVFPDSIPEKEWPNRLLEDLNLKLGLNVRLENRIVPCLVASEQQSVRDTTALKRKGWQEQKLFIYLTLLDLNTVDGPPLINDAGKSRKIWLNPAEEGITPKELLDANGITLRPENREMEVLVISNR